ncbi:Uncharacterised protein [Mycobacteroides abscessus subsp. abscessus]|nr:Uncharacterised protein [Mycobacteroides abscessus subsp. abscessus]SKV16439.1 Uncharacterised protein [Mycobacteroides abscessus subsp. abscessus]
MARVRGCRVSSFIVCRCNRSSISSTISIIEKIVAESGASAVMPTNARAIMGGL